MATTTKPITRITEGNQLYYKIHLALSVTVAATYNCSFLYKSEKRNELDNQNNVNQVNKNNGDIINEISSLQRIHQIRQAVSKRKLIHDHTKFNPVIEKPIVALDRLGGPATK